jgi:hypothetical protein
VLCAAQTRLWTYRAALAAISTTGLSTNSVAPLDADCRLLSHNADCRRAALAAISAIEAYTKQKAAADSDAAAAAAAAKAAASAPDAAGKARALQRVPAASLSKAAAAADTDVKNIMTNVAPSLNK